ncbi:MAG: THUMP-like domain-containing protein, partial [Rhodoglobus sp.]
LDFAFGLAEKYPTGIKLGPGIDRGLIPENAEAQWVSVDGDVVELGLWFGSLARPGIRRAALMITDSGTSELTADADSADADSGGLGEFVYEPDGAVIRARLIGDLARTLGGRMLDPTIAYITSDRAVPTPFAACFRVLAEFALDKRTLKREIAARGIGTLEIKKRGVDVDPAEYRTALAPRGEESGTLILTRISGRRRALLVKRV